MSFLYARSAEEEAVRLAKVAQQRAMLDSQLGGPLVAQPGAARRQARGGEVGAGSQAGYMDGFMSGFGQPGGGAPNLRGPAGGRGAVAVGDGRREHMQVSVALGVLGSWWGLMGLDVVHRWGWRLLATARPVGRPFRVMRLLCLRHVPEGV